MSTRQTDRESAQIAKEECQFSSTPEGRAWFAKWEHTQNTAAREQGFANYEHALVETDRRRWRCYA